MRLLQIIIINNYTIYIYIRQTLGINNYETIITKNFPIPVGEK